MSCDAGDGNANGGGVMTAGEVAAADAAGDLCVGSSPAPASDDACEVDAIGEDQALVALAEHFDSMSDGWTTTRELWHSNFPARTFVECLHLRRILYG